MQVCCLLSASRTESDDILDRHQNYGLKRTVCAVVRKGPKMLVSSGTVCRSFSDPWLWTAVDSTCLRSIELSPLLVDGTLTRPSS